MFLDWNILQTSSHYKALPQCTSRCENSVVHQRERVMSTSWTVGLQLWKSPNSFQTSRAETDSIKVVKRHDHLTRNITGVYFPQENTSLPRQKRHRHEFLSRTAPEYLYDLSALLVSAPFTTAGSELGGLILHFYGISTLPCSAARENINKC